MARLASAYWFCFILKGVFQTPWNFGKTLRGLLQSGGYLYLDVSDVFTGGSDVVGKLFCRYRVIWIEYYPKPLGVSTLVSEHDVLGDLQSALVVGSLTFRLLVWRHFLRALDPKFLLDSRGFPKFSAGLICDCK